MSWRYPPTRTLTKSVLRRPGCSGNITPLQLESSPAIAPHPGDQACRKTGPVARQCERHRQEQLVAAGLASSDIDYELTKMALLGHMRKRLKSLVKCKFAVHHRGDSVLPDEPIHIFEILA
jgi:hypothetical protein